jgi:hypothetical protein
MVDRWTVDFARDLEGSCNEKKRKFSLREKYISFQNNLFQVFSLQTTKAFFRFLFEVLIFFEALEFNISICGNLLLQASTQKTFRNRFISSKSSKKV